MRIISFAETTPALLAGEKTVTRRDWTRAYAKGFKAGDLVQAWNKSPRSGSARKKARCVAVIRIVSITRERYSDAPIGDWEAEGFDYLSRHNITISGAQPAHIWRSWATCDVSCWVVRFQVVEYREKEKANV
jgi:hypothetical protein